MLPVRESKNHDLTSNAFSRDLSLYNLKTPKLAILEHKADRRSLKQSPIPFSLCEYIIFLQDFLPFHMLSFWMIKYNAVEIGIR